VNQGQGLEGGKWAMFALKSGSYTGFQGVTARGGGKRALCCSSSAPLASVGAEDEGS
jgi:hypothetical protein